MNNKTQNLTTVAAQPAAPLPVNSVQEMQTLGAVLAQSQLFGQTNPAVGLAIVGMCHQKRISWLDFMQTFHMIQGTVSKKTDAILADFRRKGGTHKVIARTPEKAEAVFALDDNAYPSSITWEDCKREPFIYVGKEKDVVPLIERGAFDKLVVKAKYRTPRARMQMLWARCVSDGVRVVAPECCQGIYTPEEASDFDNVQPATGISAPAQTVAPPAAAQVAASPSPLSVEEVPCGPLVGKRWDGLDTPVLQQALNGTNPLITTEMKDYIRNVLLKREMDAKPAAEPLKVKEEPVEAEVVHA